MKGKIHQTFLKIIGYTIKSINVVSGDNVETKDLLAEIS